MSAESRLLAVVKDFSFSSPPLWFETCHGMVPDRSCSSALAKIGVGLPAMMGVVMGCLPLFPSPRCWRKLTLSKDLATSCTLTIPEKYGH